MQPKIYVVGREQAYENMFLRNGWLVATNPDDADALQFTGGEDVDPMLYGEVKHASTYSNPVRDSKEAGLFLSYETEKPIFGICRGAQFVCVMSGGRLWQDVDNHAISGLHDILDLETNEPVAVSSTHHQMMDPSTIEAGEYEILAVAGLTSVKRNGWGSVIKQDKNDHMRDIEAVLFTGSLAMGFQPHPEFFDNSHPCQRYYFDLIKRHFNLGA
jgi:gamma-glutamyl-gamma-aminobutyrate hydrolase PuuD